VWAKRYDGPKGGDDSARALAVSPDGTRVFVGGVSISSSYADYATVAYDTTNGTELWSKRYAGPGGEYDAIHAIDVSPDGTKIFVAGESTGSGTGLDYATVSYDAATGTKLWASRFKGSGNGNDYARSIVVAPDGTQVFVTGEAVGTTSAYDFVTIAYAA
jgi:DNA-binding beta-propeller fold protein YncE